MAGLPPAFLKPPEILRCILAERLINALLRRLLAPARTPRLTSESTAPDCSPLSSLVSAIVGFDKPFFEESRRIFTIEPAKTARSRRVQSGDRCSLAGQRQLVVSDGT